MVRSLSNQRYENRSFETGGKPQSNLPKTAGTSVSEVDRKKRGAGKKSLDKGH